MAMKKCHPKGLKVKPLRDFDSPLETFSFGGLSHECVGDRGQQRFIWGRILVADPRPWNLWRPWMLNRACLETLLQAGLTGLRNCGEMSILQTYFITDDSAFGKWMEGLFLLHQTCHIACSQVLLSENMCYNLKQMAKPCFQYFRMF